ncbi:MAG TPA: hypothetical protein VHP81_14240 [Lachnospiraceae bacterium]|nr:hypothetical protein [Lachnospiraceae bacterium]
MSAEIFFIVIGCYWVFIGNQVRSGHRISRETREMLTEENWLAWTNRKGSMNIMQGVSWIIIAFGYIFSVSIVMIIAGIGVIASLIGEVAANKKYVHKFLVM